MDLFVISKNETVLKGLTQFLRGQDYEVEGYSEAGSALENLKNNPPGLVLATYDAGTDEIDRLFKATHKSHTKLLLVTRPENRNHAVELCHKGAYHYILEPLNVLELKTVIKRGLERIEQNARRFTFDILATLDDPFFVLNLEMSFLYVNPRAAEFFEKGTSDLANRPITNLGSTTLEDLLDECGGSNDRRAQTNAIVGPKQTAVSATATMIHDSKERAVGYTLRLEVAKIGGEADPRITEARELALKYLTFSGEGGPDSGQRIKRFQSILVALEELQRPLVLDPIPMLVSELLELAAIRTGHQSSVKPDIALSIPAHEPRILCRRKLLEHILINLFLACTYANPHAKIRTAVRDASETLDIIVQHGGPNCDDTDLFGATLENEGITGGMALYMARLLADHHEAQLRPLIGTPNFCLSLPKK